MAATVMVSIKYKFSACSPRSGALAYFRDVPSTQGTSAYANTRHNGHGLARQPPRCVILAVSISIFNNSAAGLMSHEVNFPDYKEEKGSGAEDRAKGKEALSTPAVEGRKRCARL